MGQPNERGTISRAGVFNPCTREVSYCRKGLRTLCSHRLYKQSGCAHPDSPSTPFFERVWYTNGAPHGLHAPACSSKTVHDNIIATSLTLTKNGKLISNKTRPLQHVTPAPLLPPPAVHLEVLDLKWTHAGLLLLLRQQKLRLVFLRVAKSSRRRRRTKNNRCD